MSMGSGMRGGPKRATLGEGGGTASSAPRHGPVDIQAQKAANADAPRIPHLGRRIMDLFAPHRAALTLTVVLV